METASGPRPLGVITVVVLGIICGIAMVAMGGSLTRTFETTALGSLLSMIGLVSLGVSYGLWKGKKWAWNAGVALSGIAIIVLIAIACLSRYPFSRPRHHHHRQIRPRTSTSFLFYFSWLF